MNIVALVLRQTIFMSRLFHADYYHVKIMAKMIQLDR